MVRVRRERLILSGFMRLCQIGHIAILVVNSRVYACTHKNDPARIMPDGASWGLVPYLLLERVGGFSVERVARSVERGDGAIDCVAGERFADQTRESGDAGAKGSALGLGLGRLLDFGVCAHGLSTAPAVCSFRDLLPI